MKKLRMRLESLEVESFRTTGTPAGHGTVHGRDDCTWVDSCLCHTAYYQCGTGPQTIHSCNYTYDERCETLNELCERTAVDCLDTSYQVCGTRADTPAC
jgi:hypothetical protein